MPGVNPEVLEKLRAQEAEAAAAYAAAMKLKQDKIAAGVNLLENEEAFNEVNEAFKAHGLKAQAVEQTKDRLAQMQGWDVSAAGGGAKLLQFRADEQFGTQIDTIFRSAAKFTDSATYKAVQKMANDLGDSQFVSAFRAENPFQGGVPIFTRAEIQAALLGGRYGATAVTGSSATSAGPFIQNDLQPGFVEYMRKRPTLASVVGRGETDSDVVEYVTQSAPTNNAAPTAETNNAAESAYPFATATTNVQEIVHYVPVTRRAMADAGQVRTIIENDLVTDVLDKLDDQLATGLGTGDELQGIYTAVSVAQDKAGDSRPDAIMKAITTVRIAAGVFMDPDYIGIHPSDYESMLLETDANGQYLMGPPSQPGSRTAWGVPFLVSTVFTSGTPLVGNYQRGARLWMRSGVEVLAGLNDDDFVKRRISLMATMRAAFKTIRPTAFCEVTNF